MACVRVAVRVRPLNKRENDLSSKVIIRMEGNKTSIINAKDSTKHSSEERRKSFTYDFSYDSSDYENPNFTPQDKVFSDLGGDVLAAAFEGYNGCVFAYGQTGSGKSYTMMGNAGDLGLTPRICEGLFSQIAHLSQDDHSSFHTAVSYLEIYNERVRDLLCRKTPEASSLRVREHPKDGPYVEGLSTQQVSCYSDVEALMERGNGSRVTASTAMNQTSSRSHAIFTIHFRQARFNAELPSETTSKIHLVDLAGSERADATRATGTRLREGASINKSLVVLGNVISTLADASMSGGSVMKRKGCFIPYRDSVLTWLLKDSLGGNSKTIMIATISPAEVNYGETLSTLRYAQRVKSIVNQPTVNEDASVKIIRQLRMEIAHLRAMLDTGKKCEVSPVGPQKVVNVEEKLHRNEARVLQLTQEWTNKWRETQNILREETVALRKEGGGVVLDSDLPHLIGIDDDLLSTGVIFYRLPEGRTAVGRADAATKQDIVLDAAGVMREHCVFENREGAVMLAPLPGATCSVNGTQVTVPCQLTQGAVVLLGTCSTFRFNHPKEAAVLRLKRQNGLLSNKDLSGSSESLFKAMRHHSGEYLKKGQNLESGPEHGELFDTARRLRMEEGEEEEKKKEEEDSHMTEQHVKRATGPEEKEEEVEEEKKEIEKHGKKATDLEKEEEKEVEEDGEEEVGHSVAVPLLLEDRCPRQHQDQEPQHQDQESDESTDGLRDEAQGRAQPGPPGVVLNKDASEDTTSTQQQQQGSDERTAEMRDDAQCGGQLDCPGPPGVLNEDASGDTGTQLSCVTNGLAEEEDGDVVQDASAQSSSSSSLGRGYPAPSLKPVPVRAPDGVSSFPPPQDDVVEEHEDEGAASGSLFSSSSSSFSSSSSEPEAPLSPPVESTGPTTAALPTDEEGASQMSSSLSSSSSFAFLSPPSSSSIHSSSNTSSTSSSSVVFSPLSSPEPQQQQQQQQQDWPCHKSTAGAQTSEEASSAEASWPPEGEKQQQQQQQQGCVWQAEQEPDAGAPTPTPADGSGWGAAAGPAAGAPNEHPGPPPHGRGGPSLHGAGSGGTSLVGESQLGNLSEGGEAVGGRRAEGGRELSLPLANVLPPAPSSPSLSPPPPTALVVEPHVVPKLEPADKLAVEVQFNRGVLSSLSVQSTQAPQPTDQPHTDSDTTTTTSTSGPNSNSAAASGGGGMMGWMSCVLKDAAQRHLPRAPPLLQQAAPNLAGLYTQVCSLVKDVPLLQQLKLELTFAPEATQAAEAMDLRGQLRSHSQITELLSSSSAPGTGPDGSPNMAFPLANALGALNELTSLLQPELQGLCANQNLSYQEQSLQSSSNMANKKGLPWHGNTEMQSTNPADTTGLLKIDSPTGTSEDNSTAQDVSSPAVSPWASVQVWAQRLVDFPPPLQHLQSLPVDRLLPCLLGVLPDDGALVLSQRPLALFWLSAGTCSHPEPQPALALLLESGLYSLKAACTHGNQASCFSHQSSSHCLKVFHHLPFAQLRDIHVGFAGLSLRLMGTTAAHLVTLYTHSAALTQDLCRSVLSVVAQGEPDVNKHPLLTGDLLRMALDWASPDTPDLLLAAGLRVGSCFPRSLTQLVCLLHGNMKGRRPALAQVRVLLYATVLIQHLAVAPKSHKSYAIVGMDASKEEGASADMIQFFLTDTHLGLVREDAVFYPPPRSLSLAPSRPQFSLVQLRARDDVRCVVVKDDTRLDVVLAHPDSTASGGHQEGRPQCGLRTTTTTNATGRTRTSMLWAELEDSSHHPSVRAEVWKLSFAGAAEASCLINYLSDG